VGPGGLPPIIIQQNGFGLRVLRWLAAIGWFGFMICGLWAVGQLIALASYFDTTEGLTEEYHSGAKFGRNKVAIVQVSGVILDGEGYVKRQIERIRKDEAVRAVVVRIDSPGGTITGSDYIYHHLKKLREERELPLVVSMGSLAASGGYYVAMAVGDQEDCIYAEPTTTTGSIGVIVPHYDLSGLLERIDVKDDSVASHPRKQMLSMTLPMSQDHRQLVERYVQEAFERFKMIVRSGRPGLREDEAALDQLATGEVFTAAQAEQNGLIDSIGFIEEAIERAQELANLDPETTRVVEYDRPITLSDLAGLSQAEAQPQNRLAALLEWSVPRGYYLFTSLPPLVASGLRD
jgi:protease-4